VEKQKVFVSFSGGETSAYMCNYLLLNFSDKYDMRFLFANTGEETEETLQFVEQCDKYFGLNLVWVEYDCPNHKPSYKVVDFETAYRSHDQEEISNHWPNHPFNKMVNRYGIPNRKFPHCTRDLKEYPMTRYLSANGWKPKDYKIAIGIRSDEIDRVGKHYYPLVHADITKPLINRFWSSMPFRLGIKTYEGNCKTCWKKSFRKLGTISIENPNWFNVFSALEQKYSAHAPRNRNTEDNPPPYMFFRGNMTVHDIFEIAKKEGFEKAVDERHLTNYQVSLLHDGTELDMMDGCQESCEVFT